MEELTLEKIKACVPGGLETVWHEKLNTCINVWYLYYRSLNQEKEALKFTLQSLKAAIDNLSLSI